MTLCFQTDIDEIYSYISAQCATGSCPTVTGVCVAQRLLGVQADTDVSSIRRGRVAARPSPLIVSAPAAG